MSKVVINVDVLTDLHKDEDLYVTGNFNRWIPGDASCKLYPAGDSRYSIILENYDKPLIEYKCCRGAFTNLECGLNGRLLNMTERKVEEDITIDHTVVAWRDDFTASTASENVKLLSEAFYIPQLNRHRRIWIYLPGGYQDSGQHYPVIYMHDGQDLFDEATSEGRTGPVEWGVDEILDEAAAPCIIVAIAHDGRGNNRFNEYSFYPGSNVNIPQGKQYLDFIVHTLKPYVDNHFRTVPGKGATGIAGSSLGGLISLYAGIHYPEVFGNIGVLSPSLWVDGKHAYEVIAELTEEQKEKIKTQRYFFYAGSREIKKLEDGQLARLDEDMNGFVKDFSKRVKTEIHVQVDPDGKHGAWYWSGAFKWFYEKLSINNNK